MQIGKKKRVTDFSKYRTMIYGVPGAGKTTLASKFPDAFFIPTEAGLNYLEVDCLMDDDGNPMVCKTWDEFTKAILLTKSIAESGEYKTVIIDTIDNAFELARQKVFKDKNWESESDGQYGAGWSIVADEFKKWIRYLLSLNIGVVIISHYVVEEKEENGIKRLYTNCSLNKRVRKDVVAPLDFAFYCHLDNDLKRIMTVKETPNIFAKDRTGKLGDQLPMDYKVLEQKLNEALKQQQKENK
jgi:hypothetical protein